MAKKKPAGPTSGKDYVAIAERYIDDIIAGRIPASKWTKLACERQRSDRYQKQFAYAWDSERANRACRFVEHLRHVKGRWGTANIVLEPWQCFVITTVFGWVDEHGFRRFREAYVEMARKNAKTTMCSAVALFLLVADNEPGAEVYSAATTRDQARIAFDIARNMARKDAEFTGHFGIEALTHTINTHDGGAFRPVASEADTLDGLSPSGAIIDEFHAHKTRDVYEVLKTGTGSRKQALMWVITTAGFDRSSPCYEHRNYVQQVLAGDVEDATLFGAIYTLDENDDWQDPKNWIKANPNLGVSVFEQEIATQCRQAVANVGAQVSFLTKRLNVWTQSAEAYFNTMAWEQLCKVDGMKPEDFIGKRCLIGIDFATRFDIAASVKVFEVGDGLLAVFGRYYIPSGLLEKGGHVNYALYDRWVRQGHLTVTPGDEIDGDFLDADLRADIRRYQPDEVCYDPYQLWELRKKWKEDGITAVEIPQNFKNLSEPLKNLAGRIVGGRIKHNGDPVLAWMVSNVTAKMDAQDNHMPTKSSAMAKIDGVSAMLNAMHRYLAVGAVRDPLPMELEIAL